MRFQVPQFIEVEDKIFGPLTLKQFIYLAGGGGLSFIVYVVVHSLLFAALPIFIIMAISAALAFYKVNNKSFITIVEAGFKYMIGGKLYIWKKAEKPLPTSTAQAVSDAKKFASVMVPKISNSRLKDLTWSLDVKESMYADQHQR